MSIARKLSTLTAITALAATGVAGAANAPVVSDQAFIAGDAPISVPGTSVQKGEWMGSKQRLVFRDVTLSGRQKARVTLRARKGETIRGIAVDLSQGIGVNVVGHDARDSYVGERQVVVRTFRTVNGAAGERTARIYALVRR
jgi:hypothetical protein